MDLGPANSDGGIRIARIVVLRALVESGDWFGEEGYETAELRLVEGTDEVGAVVREVGGDPRGTRIALDQ